MIDPKEILLPADCRDKAVVIDAVNKSGWDAWQRKLTAAERKWTETNGFPGESGRHLVIPSREGTASRIVLCLDDSANSFAPGRLARLLPQGLYALGGGISNLRHAALSWCLESYQFAAYGKNATPSAKLRCPRSVDRDEILRTVEAVYATSDLINTPASDLGPDELERACRDLARSYKASIRVIKGRALQREFPMIYAVGMASPRAPRFVDITWGSSRAKKVTLAGKGVCFDTGGLDIKPASGMLLMKKDMGGAATVLGLSRMIMGAKLPVRLRILIPIVENAISGNAFRPGDVLKSRKGLTVEIGNTDAEGRLILADALALADEEKPDLLIDMATLTGAARVALGPDLPAFYTDDEDMAAAVSRAAKYENDPLWRMPFWNPYHRLFESPIAAMNNSSDSGYAGSITAALFLKRFVETTKSYVHFDIFAWTPQARPGWPKGAACQGMRALFAVIAERFRR